ncbi:hypothetical protein DL546_006463 [Coniochaeta pulveracea]|uniref:mannan endo-1,4-beta-mannosidase n=1 Tax=Coniochaeta pulveracea TaxID=177199 RepID=A0A420Y500_9PEZI|nr:hypothetical protein DL546_006463 [Coniochaeta pulveracea]
MKPTILLLAAAVLATPGHSPRSSCRDIRDAHVIRQGSSLLLAGKSWRAVGANVYWLGLDENVLPPPGEPYYVPLKASYPTRGRITEIMAIVKALGGTMIRAHTLGVSTGNPLSVMPSLGVVNQQAFESIDWAVYQARQYGLRLMVPLTDNYDYYHGGKYDFLRWNGWNLTQSVDANNLLVQQFYTNHTVVESFKGYIHTLLTHVNRYTGLSYAEDPTIFAYETGNELSGPVWGDMDVPADWLRDISSYVKELAPRKLVVDGTYGVNRTHLGVEEVDVFSDHYYPISLSKLKEDLALVAGVNKTYFAGEYDWVGQTSSGASNGDSLSEWYSVIEQTPGAVGDAFWSLFGHNVPDCSTFVNHIDGFTLQYNNPANSAYTDSRIELIRQHLVKMSEGVSISADAALPAVTCPASTMVSTP